MRFDPNTLGPRPDPAAAAMTFDTAHHDARLTPAQRHKQLTDQTAKWVSQTFFGQMLKQMRDSPFKSKLFDGGRGGEAFQQMADQHTADAMARGAGHKLVDAIVRRIEHRSAYAKPAARGRNLGVA